MSKGKGKSSYRCTFCRERLVTLPLEGADYLRAVFLIRPFQCPHCFTYVNRPFSWIAKIPIIGWFARSSVFSEAASKTSGKLPHRDGDVGGPVTKSIAKFGRWVNDCERRIGRFFGAIARGIWAVIWFLPSLIFGKRKRKRKSSNKRFIKSRD